MAVASFLAACYTRMIFFNAFKPQTGNPQPSTPTRNFESRQSMFNDLETDDVSSVLPSCHLFGRVNILVCIAENAVFAAEGPKICDISGHQQQYSLTYPHQNCGDGICDVGKPAKGANFTMFTSNAAQGSGGTFKDRL